MTYEIKVDDMGQEVLFGTDAQGVVWCIPSDPNNAMYQEYLKVKSS